MPAKIKYITKLFLDLDKIVSVIFIVLFFIAINFSYLNGFAHFFKDISSSEKRTLATCPNLEIDTNPGKYRRFIKELQAYPNKFESCFNDGFQMRNYTIQLMNSIRLSAFGISPSEMVKKGKDGWYYYYDAEEEASYTNTNLFNDKSILDFKNALEERKAKLNSMGIAYVFMVTPNKSTIYPEYLPDSFPKKNSSVSKLDQLVKYLKDTNSSVSAVDVRSDLMNAKSENTLFYQTDSHWNQKAGYIAYTKLMQEVQKQMPNVKILTEQDFEVNNRSNSVGDLAQLMGTDNFIKEPAVNNPGYNIKDKSRDYTLTRTDGLPDLGPNSILNITRFETHNNNTLLPDVIVFRDSFIMSIVPFLSSTFGYVRYELTHLRYQDYIATGSGNTKLVIEEAVERYF